MLGSEQDLAEDFASSAVERAAMALATVAWRGNDVDDTLQDDMQQLFKGCGSVRCAERVPGVWWAATAAKGAGAGSCGRIPP